MQLDPTVTVEGEEDMLQEDQYEAQEDAPVQQDDPVENDAAQEDFPLMQQPEAPVEDMPQDAYMSPAPEGDMLAPETDAEPAQRHRRSQRRNSRR